MEFECGKIESFLEVVGTANSCVITCHRSPDGDAMGSSLALMHALRGMGKYVTVVVPDAFPSSLAFLPGAESIVVASYDYEYAERIISEADTIFCLDFNDVERLDRFAPYISNADCRKVMIDHHLNSSGFADLEISYPEKSSTSLLVYMLLDAAGLSEYISLDAAVCCCAGMMTDTGNFSYNSLDSDIYLTLAKIVAKGVDKDRLYKLLFDTSCERRIRLMGYCKCHKMELIPEYAVAVITLSRAECEEFGYRKGDTESLVNVPLSIPEVLWSVYLREDPNGLVKVSMRSKGEFSVRDICASHFGGGGHQNAAGGEFYGTIDEASAALKAIMPLYKEQINKLI